MRFGILGPVHVDDGGVPVVLRTPKQRALLAVLLAHDNSAVSADRLIELLWNGAPSANGIRALHVHLSQLRRALHPQRPQRRRDELLVRLPAGYQVTVAPGDLDLHRFEQLVGQARQARARGDIQRAAVCLWQALKLWRGLALAGIDVVALQQTVVPQLEEARFAALEEHVEVDLLLGRHDQLIGELQALVVEWPLRERLWGQLMVALYRAGRQGEALAAYSRARGRLVAELGIEPRAALQRLQRQILPLTLRWTHCYAPTSQQRPSTPRTGATSGWCPASYPPISPHSPVGSRS